jgi:hypothetical protein
MAYVLLNTSRKYHESKAMQQLLYESAGHRIDLERYRMQFHLDCSK